MRLLACLLACSLAAEDQPIPLRGSLDTAQAMYATQVLQDLDHPVGEAITVAGLTLACRRGDKGELEIDLKGDGRFKKLTKAGAVAVEVPLAAEDGKRAKTAKLSLYLSKNSEDAWQYRVASQVTLNLGKEAFAIVDVNGNGVFNEAGVDGMCLAGQTWLFPLPGPDERFCTETLDLTGLRLGPLGDDVALAGRPLSTTVPEALPVLIGVNRERGKLGLTPRPEDPRLSADLQKHCAYMARNNTLTHPEDSGKPGYTKEGHEAGMRSILSQGTPAARVAEMMVETYFHRQDVIRPETLAFGVGYEGRFGGIDGRTRMAKASSYRWPVLCPVPDQTQVATRYQTEAPDATPGDDKAGTPITVYFGSGKPTLKRYELVSETAPAAPIPCYPFDHQQGASANMTGYQHCVAIIPRDPLANGIWHQVTIEADHGGTTWAKTWRFQTK